MRDPDAAAIAAARKTSLPAVRHDDVPAQLVCLALVLAVITLACRIAHAL
jgi:hypothetical protein